MRCALIGYGRIGRLVKNLLDEDPQRWALSSICDVRATARAGLSVPFLSGYGAALTDAEAVLITTPPDSHFRIAMDALEAGRDVFVEKPPASNSEECRKLIKKAELARRSLFFGFHGRYNAGVQQALLLLRNRRITQLRIQYREDVQRYHSRDSWVHAQGVLRDSGINALSIMRLLVPASEEIRFAGAAKTGLRNSAGGETQLQMEVRFGLNGAGSLDLDWRFQGAEKRIIGIVTEEGSYEIDVTTGRFRAQGASWDSEPVEDPMRAEYKLMLEDFARHWTERTSDASTSEMEVIDSYERSRRHPDRVRRK